MLISASLAHPASGANSTKQFEVTSQSYLGYAQFTVSYNSSATAVVGTNLTVSATVLVDNLTGAEEYVRDYVLVAILFCNDHSVNSSVGSPTPTQTYLYPGAHWWGLNFSIPLTKGDTGLSPGQTANASLTLRLITDIEYDSPDYRESGYAPVSGDGSTFVQILAPGTLHAATEMTANQGVEWPQFLVVGAGALILVVSFTAFRRRAETMV